MCYVFFCELEVRLPLFRIKQYFQTQTLLKNTPVHLYERVWE